MNGIRRLGSQAAALTSKRVSSPSQIRTMASLPTPKFFNYDTVKSNLNVGQAFKAVEEAFAMLADGKVRRQSMQRRQSSFDYII